MIGLLRAESRRIERLGRAVEEDAAALAAARSGFAERLRAELARPKVLLAIFAAGLGYGWLRAAPSERREPENDDGGPDTGRLARVAAAVIAGARLIEHARRAAELVGPLAVRPAAPPNGDGDGSDLH